MKYRQVLSTLLLFLPILSFAQNQQFLLTHPEKKKVFDLTDRKLSFESYYEQEDGDYAFNTHLDGVIQEIRNDSVIIKAHHMYVYTMDKKTEQALKLENVDMRTEAQKQLYTVPLSEIFEVKLNKRIGKFMEKVGTTLAIGGVAGLLAFSTVAAIKHNDVPEHTGKGLGISILTGATGMLISDCFGRKTYRIADGDWEIVSK
ncbi:hypothetical protein [Jiulongibacter sp. NS-SX5]|uniref:hypothetical protein n=1 Tax=Jiulongibacter sp. NS-SX5 TaxID=3463854 RepID=UPI004058297C